MLVKNFSYSDSLKCRMVGEILFNHFDKKENERNKVVTDALKSVEKDQYYKSLIYAYQKRWSFRKNARFSYCSEYALRMNKRRLLLNIYDYIEEHDE